MKANKNENAQCLLALTRLTSNLIEKIDFGCEKPDITSSCSNFLQLSVFINQTKRKKTCRKCARLAHASVSIGKFIYVFRGLNRMNERLRSCER